MTTISERPASETAANPVPEAAGERPFAIDAIHHLALVCSDMKRTVDFYTRVLGFKLIKTIDMGNGGQHFFLEFAPGQAVAFFQFPNAPEKIEGVTAPGFGRRDAEGRQVNRLSGVSAQGTMHHLAFRVPLEKIDEYQRRLAEAGLAVSEVVHHGGRRTDACTGETVDTDFALSVYFSDPDGIGLEFCAYTRELHADDVLHAPNTAAAPARQSSRAALSRSY